MAPVASNLTKVLSLEELLALRAEARETGRSVVQCHGCFDIVHPGHVRHLKHAAEQGDILLVSITADAVMRKGDGRPLFPQELRAENLAALDCVDWVYINPDDTAVRLLGEAQPDIYIKGREYEGNADPRFAAERATVERWGGRVVFSSGDIVFSSTALIGAMEHRVDPFHARLRQLVEQGEIDGARLGALTDSFRGKRVCVFGETIVDTYVMCDRPDVASEGPIMSLRPLERTSFDGGAAIIARHLAAMGARPVLVTALPRTVAAEALRRRLAVEGVEVAWVEHDGSLMEKQRFLVGSQKVMKVDMVRGLTLDATSQNELLTLARQSTEGCDGAIIADFGQGLFTGRVMAELLRVVRPRVPFIAGDVSGARNSMLKMRGVDLVCPTEHELRSAVGDFEDSLNAVVWKFLDEAKVGQAFVTLGGEGMIAFDRLPGAESDVGGWRSRVRGEHVPALAPHPVDTLGCGDALLAGASLAMMSGGRMVDAAVVGSVAAGVEAMRLGNEVVTAADLRRGIGRVVESRLSVETGHVGAAVV